MSTVVARRIRATPHRTSVESWSFITDLLCRGSKTEEAVLESVVGIAASILADKVPKDAPIVVKGEGPRVRIYSIYDGDAIDGDDANEDKLTWKPLKGDWKIYLPCDVAELEWTSAALAKKTQRIIAYDSSTKPGKDSDNEKAVASKEESFSIDFNSLNDL